VFGKVLGRGGFCVVTEITNIKLKDDSKKDGNNVKIDDEHRIHDIVQDRNFMAQHCIRQGKDCRYAIKQIQDSIRSTPDTFVNGLVDLAIEARFLAVVRHPNIIKMRAMSTGSPYDPSFFVVLDRLYDILSKRLLAWKKRMGNKMSKLMDRGGKKKLAFWLERLTFAYDLGCALKYLHDANILYRDIKPDNIGFDVRGDIKIFDFGLAKELHEDQKLDNGLYKLTGDTGSPRYMAPEVALGKPYNETCDVYSFSILTWQMLRVETPFELYGSMKSFRTKVVEQGVRPGIDPKWPDDISTMLRNCWSPDIAKRPSMDDVCETLRGAINRDTDEEIVEIMDASRRSELSLRNGAR
jgi:serine/threonine protein kinase